MEDWEFLETHYINRQKFTEVEIDRLKTQKIELTYKDYLPIDTFNNFTENQGTRWFCEKYKPEGLVVDIGAGLGGGCRIMHCEFGLSPIGLELYEEYVDLGNQISSELGIPEFLQPCDASQPLPFAEVDVVFLLEVLSTTPKELQTPILENIYNSLKPGGLLYLEDFGFETPDWEPAPEREEDFARNKHWLTGFYLSDIRPLIEQMGFEEVEFIDNTQEVCEWTWARSNDYFLPWYETENELMDSNTAYYAYLYSRSQPKIWSDLQHMTSEEIRDRYPITSQYIDPDFFVHCVPHDDIKSWKFVLRKPFS